ncbi:MAG: hypothetical protein KA807_20695 [Prolixibacteraceae bacterium]|nr:hypothetical protein [Prolixibacteraceae bacterium]
MKKITIEIETVNAAFEDCAEGLNETTCIMGDITDKMIQGLYSKGIYNIMDSNGNKCGKITIE